LISIAGKYDFAQPQLVQSGDDISFDYTFGGTKAVRVIGADNFLFSGHMVSIGFLKSGGGRLDGPNWQAATFLSNINLTLTGVRQTGQGVGGRSQLSLPVGGMSGVQQTEAVIVAGDVRPKTGESIEFTGIKGSFHINELGGPASFAEMGTFSILGRQSEIQFVDATAAPPADVPEPASLMLGAVGLLSLAAARRRRHN
jgi:hypothetical protein